MAEIPRCHRPTLEQFREQFAAPGFPVILTGLTDDWAARRWTPSELARRYPDVRVSVTPRDSVVEGTRETRLSDYIETVEQGRDGGDYLTSWCFRSDCPELLEDFTVPVYFQEDWLEELPQKNDMMWLFLGAQGSGMGLHQDLGHTAAWNAQVTGKKRWAIIAPEFEDYLYDGEVCAFEPDLKRFPKFRHVRVQFADVEAGEVLFIPGAWWHQTRNLETGFSITANYVDETNYRTVLTCLEWAEEDELFAMLNEVAQRKVATWK